MKEQKTLNDLISYYEEELKYTNKSINDTEIENACERERESNYKLFLSQLKQLKEDNPYQEMWEELKKDNSKLIEYGNRAVKDCKIYKNRKMKILEQKYLGVKNNE